MKRSGLWILVGAAGALGYWLYADKPDLLGGVPNIADISAATSPAAASYEQYATAMANQNFGSAAQNSVASANETARTRKRATHGTLAPSGDRTYLSKAALDEMKRTAVDAEEEVDFRYDYDRIEINASGKVVEIEAVQTLRSPSRTALTRQRATVMEIAGEWKVSEFWLVSEP